MPYEDLEVWQVGANGLHRRGREPQPSLSRPEGEGFVRYEDYYRTGDDLQATFNRVDIPGSVLTFPPGEFYTDNKFSKGYLEGLRHGHRDWGRNVRGIAGSGNTADPNVSTVFTMQPATIARRTSGAVLETMIAANPHPSDPIMDGYWYNFHIRGVRSPATNGGLVVFHGLTIRRSKGTVSHVNGSALDGTSSGPPGEVGVLATQNCQDLDFRNCDIDGRRDGTPVASSPIMINNSTRVNVYNSYLHDTLHGGGGIAYHNVTDSETHNVRFERIGSEGGQGGPNSINHEQADNIRHYNPVMIAARRPGVPSFHIGLNSKDNISTKVYLYNPTWDDIGWEGRLTCYTWTLQTGAQSQTEPCYAFDADNNPIDVYWNNPW